MEDPPENDEGMSIGSLSSRTGVPVDTLRAWERRYGVLRPGRTEGGQRRYKTAEVERVLWLVARCAEGQRISEAVAALTAVSGHTNGAASADTVPVDTLIVRMVTATCAGDTTRMEHELDRAFAALPLMQTIELVVFPALADLGRRWAAGEPVVAAEHLLSNAVDRRLAGRLLIARQPRGPIAVIACPSGERHSVGALTLSVLMAQDGWRITFLGADTPIGDADALAHEQQAHTCVAVCTVPGSALMATQAIDEMAGSNNWVLAGPDAWAGPKTTVPVWGPDLQSARDAAARRAVEANAG